MEAGAICTTIVVIATNQKKKNKLREDFPLKIKKNK